MSSKVSSAALPQRSKNAPEVKVTLVGLNRITASLGKAMRMYSTLPTAAVSFFVLGRDEDKDAMKNAQKVGAVDNFHRVMQEALENADIVVVDVPLRQQEETFQRMGEVLKAGAVVLDLAPLKKPGVKYARQYFRKDADGDPLAHLVGITPLVSFDEVYDTDTDVEAANELLFHRNDILVVPDAKASAEAVKVVSDLADFLAMTPRFMDPDEYDAMAALVEGVPPLLGLLMVQTILQSPSKSDFLRVVNTPFAVASYGLHNQSVDDLMALWEPNKISLLNHIDQLIAALRVIREVFMEKDPEASRAYISQILDGFIEWEIRRRDNKWEDPTLDAAANFNVGIGLGQMFGLRRRKSDDK